METDLANLHNQISEVLKALSKNCVLKALTSSGTMTVKNTLKVSDDFKNKQKSL